MSLHEGQTDRLSVTPQYPKCQGFGQDLCQEVCHPSTMERVLRDQIAARLKALQRVAQATDQQMADYVGVSRTAWVNATTLGPGKKVNKPSEEAMIRLCEKAGLTMEWIYRGDLSHVPFEMALALREEMKHEMPPKGAEATTVVRLPGMRATGA